MSVLQPTTRGHHVSKIPELCGLSVRVWSPDNRPPNTVLWQHLLTVTTGHVTSSNDEDDLNLCCVHWHWEVMKLKKHWCQKRIIKAACACVCVCPRRRGLTLTSVKVLSWMKMKRRFVPLHCCKMKSGVWIKVSPPTLSEHTHTQLSWGALSVCLTCSHWIFIYQFRWKQDECWAHEHKTDTKLQVRFLPFCSRHFQPVDDVNVDGITVSEWCSENTTERSVKDLI